MQLLNVTDQDDVDTEVDGGLTNRRFTCNEMTKESSTASADFSVIVSATN
jgi:hypothetical protein